MKRKRTIANLLQESNEPVTPAANLISTLIQSKKLDEKKTFVKEYFDKDMTQDDTATTTNNIITETNTNTIMDSIVQNESSNTTISTLINQKSQKKSKIKDYVFDKSNNNNNNTSTYTDSSPCSISSVSSLLEVNLGDVKTSTKTIGSLINNNNNCKEKVKLLCKNESIEKKSKIKDYITNTPSSPSTPPSAQTLSITNHQLINKNTIHNKLNESKLKINAFNQRMISNNKTKKRNKIKDYIVSQRINDLIGLNSTKKISNCKKGFSKNNFTLKKMNVKNHLQQNLKQTDTIIENPKIISTTNNKSTIKEYLQNKSQRSKMINNKENLMTKKIYFKNGL